jgi:hypothetical protein
LNENPGGGVKIPKWAYTFDLAWRGVSGIPELRRLDPADAYRVVIAARQAVRNEKDADLYRQVVDGHGVLLILCVFFLLPFIPTLVVWFTGSDRLLNSLFYFLLWPSLIAFFCYQRVQGPKKLRPYVVEVLRKRDQTLKAGLPQG